MTAKEIITKNLKIALKKSAFRVDDFDVAHSSDPIHGDYTTNVVLKIASVGKKNPRKVAEKIIKNLSTSKEIEKVEIAGPGFINFFMAPKWVCQQVGYVASQDAKFGASKTGKGKKVMVEFISANPTGPLTLGNGRGGFLGDVLANVLGTQGYDVTREYYINDTGGQIEALGQSVRVANEGKEGTYKGEYVGEVAKQLSKSDFEKGDLALGKKAAKIILEKLIKKTLKNMAVKFDSWFSEKPLQKKYVMESVITQLKSKGFVYEKEGALWFASSKLGDWQDWVLKKSDGQYTYFASDIAYHLNKFKERKFLGSIDIWGADHGAHVGKLKNAMKVFGYENRLEIIINQLVRLISGGKEIKMSKRLGTYVTLDELLEEIPLDVARFFFLSRSPGSHMDFNLDLAKEKSEKNPVYYVQYAHARIASIMRKAGRQVTEGKVNFGLLKSESEQALIKQLLRYPEVLEEVAGDYQVQKLPTYANELATAFHNFYHKNKVIIEDKKLMQARLALLLATKQVLANALGVMGISAPEQM